MFIHPPGGKGVDHTCLLAEVPLRKGFEMNLLSCLNLLLTLIEKVTVLTTFMSGKFKKHPSKSHGMAVFGYNYFSHLINKNIQWPFAVWKALCSIFEMPQGY